MSVAAMPQYTDIMKSLTGSLAAPNTSQAIQGIFGNSPAVRGFSSMMQQANQANATRGQDILGLLQQQGTAQMGINRQNLNQQEGQISQDMIDKGLANTSVGAGLDQKANDQFNLANENVTEKSALNIANAANSFTQQAPSMDMLASLMKGATSGAALSPTAPNGAISSSANGITHQLNNGQWQAMNIGTGVGI